DDGDDMTDLSPRADQLHLLSDDDGRSWRVYLMHDGNSETDGAIWWGCTLDREAARIDGVLRWTPSDLSEDGLREEIWEAPSRAPKSIEQRDLILTNPQRVTLNVV